MSALTLRTGRCSFLFSGDINVKKALVSFPGLAGPSHTLLGSSGLVWEPPIQAKRKWEGAPGSMARAVPAQMSFGNWLRTSRAHWSGQVWPALLYHRQGRSPQTLPCGLLMGHQGCAGSRRCVFLMCVCWRGGCICSHLTDGGPETAGRPCPHSLSTSPWPPSRLLPLAACSSSLWQWEGHPHRGRVFFLFLQQNIACCPEWVPRCPVPSLSRRGEGWGVEQRMTGIQGQNFWGRESELIFTRPGPSPTSLGNCHPQAQPPCSWWSWSLLTSSGLVHQVPGG